MLGCGDPHGGVKSSLNLDSIKITACYKTKYVARHKSRTSYIKLSVVVRLSDAFFLLYTWVFKSPISRSDSQSVRLELLTHYV